MNDDNNVIHLSEHIQNNKKIDDVNLYENIKLLKKPQSNIVNRTVAFAVDFMIVLFINSSIHAAYALFVNQFLYPLDDKAKLLLLTSNTTLQMSIFLFLFGAYFLYSGVVLNGKTFGKTIMKLSIINEAFVINHIHSDHQITMTQSFQRTLGYLLCYFSFGAFFIFNFASEDQRGLSDYLSGTRTVDDEWLKLMLEHKEYAAEEVSIDIRSLDRAA